MRKRQLLVVSDSKRIIDDFSSLLSNSFQVFSEMYVNFEDSTPRSQFYDYLLIDFDIINAFTKKKFNESFYNERIKYLKEIFPGSRIILFFRESDSDMIGPLIQLGVDNVIQLPISKELIKHRLLIEDERIRYKETIRESLIETESADQLFKTHDSKFANELRKLKQVALSKSNILITGETGTGKSLLAKHIHLLSSRRDFQFVSVHCGAIPESLIESELFGHEKGAFTGAINRKIGRFELSDKGTLFLDEIGTVNKNVQIKLLQVLQERFIQRVGGESSIPLDLRFIAATNNDLKSYVKKGDFREDLYYRLNVFHIEIPPLRERKDDIEVISKGILRKLSLENKKSILSISEEVLKVFYRYSWPGNIRELENILERAYVLEGSREITIENIPRDLIPESQELIDISPLNRKSLSLNQARNEVILAFEKKYLTELLIAHNGDAKSMSEEAQVTVRQIHKLLAKHGIKAKEFSIKLNSLKERD